MEKILDFSSFSNKELFYPKRTTIASYPGGKSDKKKHLPLYLSIPKSIDYLIEPFAGLANVFITISPRVSRVWLNDKDPEIYSLLNCINDPILLHQLTEYVKSLEPIEKDSYYHWKQLVPSKTLDRAMRRLVILNCSPNGAGGGYSKEKAHRKWYRNKPLIWQEIHQILSEKEVRITNLDYKEVLSTLTQIESTDNSFLYLDPPYYNVAQKGSLYGKKFNQIDIVSLRTLLAPVTIHWLLSNRDSPDVRDIFSQFHLFGYNTYNDMNNTKKSNPELLVSNQPLI
ncbi:MAG: DNA adenine methylase [Candidatus Hodarchaeales archaeon]|jgi:DNA adenine methylase